MFTQRSPMLSPSKVIINSTTRCFLLKLSGVIICNQQVVPIRLRLAVSPNSYRTCEWTKIAISSAIKATPIDHTLNSKPIFIYWFYFFEAFSEVHYNKRRPCSTDHTRICRPRFQQKAILMRNGLHSVTFVYLNGMRVSRVNNSKREPTVRS